MYKKGIILIFLISAAFITAEDYVFGSIENLAEQKVGTIVLPEIYRKLGYNITILPMPGKRAQSEAVSGSTDGEIMRIFSYGAENPSLIRVPTPYYYLETTAFVRKGSGIVIKSREDLEKHRVVKVSGVKHTNNITRGLASEVFDIGSTSQMMRFLAAGRADVALTNTLDGMLVLKDLGLEGIVPAGPPLAVWDLYHYIHKRNRNLVPGIDAVIKQMKSDGELEALVSGALARIRS